MIGGILICKLPFNSIHTAFQWYFNKAWVRSNRAFASSWPKCDKIQTSPQRDDAEIVYEAFMLIKVTLEQILTLRDIDILRSHYLRRDASQAEVAIRYDLTDRGVRYIRDRVIFKTEDAFMKKGIVRKPTTEKIEYAAE